MSGKITWKGVNMRIEGWCESNINVKIHHLNCCYSTRAFSHWAFLLLPTKAREKLVGHIGMLGLNVKDANQDRPQI